MKKEKGGNYLFSIKNSFSNCSVCDLLEEPSCILETNCKSDLKKVDVVFVAENPGKNEIKKGVPLIGKAGKMFRKYFVRFGLNKMNYLLTNVVLCQTKNPDGTTGNPTQEVIDLCKDNCMNIIKTCDPKLIVLMGTSPMSAFGIAKTGITNIHERYELFDWEGYKTLVVVHPSFVNRSQATWEPKFSEAMSRISEMLGGEKIEMASITKAKSLGKGIYRYKIPEKFYTEDYRLVDVQFLNRTSQVLYIFRDKDNNKVFHKESDDYICYQAPKGVEARKLVPYDQLDQISIKYRDRYNLDSDITYEGDVRIATKHAMDYYHYSKGECKKTESNIMFFDIEVDTGDERVFPKPEDAAFPINMITTIFNGKRDLYVIDNKTEPIQKIDNINYNIFTNEKKLLQTFIKDFKSAAPDFLAGWNCISFDLAYIYNRSPQIGIQQTSMTSFNEFYVEPTRFICHTPGTIAIDQDFLYRTFTFTKMENYKLGFIAQHELDGFTKIDLPLPFNEMYWKMLNKTIEYNIRDTELLEKLDDKLDHINLLNELRIICNANFESTSSFGQIDSIMVSYLRNKGIASKNSDPHIVKEEYPGAYVFEPIAGVYDWITDFDFASLYPSLMITYNIGVNSFVMKTKDPKLGYELAYCPENLPEKIEMIIDPMYEKKIVHMDTKTLYKNIQNHKFIHTINGCFFQPHEKEFSVFGEIVDMLMTSRKDYKGKMFDAIEAKDEDAENFYFTRQLVYKVLANTLYGVVANKAFRFFDLSLAAAVTVSGQEALKTSIVEGDAFMRHLATEKEYIKPNTVSKLEMFADPDKEAEIYKLPDRSREFIITGDTDSIFCNFENFPEEKTIKNIHGWCEKIENFLNEDKIIEVVKRHNVDLEYNRLKLKNELIISRGLFLAKKRYVIRVINNEGKEIDKVKYMGVEIKRSDYPSKSKEFLTNLLDLLLKSDKVSLTNLMQFVNREEQEFIKAILEGDKSVARPVTYGKRLKDYKMIPQGVRAMETWNKLMYDIHKTGTKAYMYWVQGIDIEEAPKDVRERYHKFVKDGHKLEVIAIPDEESRLPNFFIPNKQAALKFTFKDRYELMLKPLELKVKKQEVLTF
jgi:uracil-DNA glycosylase family 4